MLQSRGSGGLRGGAKERKAVGVGAGGWKGWGTRPRDAELSTGMTEMRGSRRQQEADSKGAFAGYTAGVATLFLLLTWGVSGSLGMARPPPSSQLQELPPAYEEWNLAELAELLANAEPQERERKLANIVEWIQLRQQQLQQQDEAGFEAEGNARMAVPPPLVHGAGMRHVAEEDADDDGKGKRGSFMSLCHFKICNMGRKRNLRYNPLARA